MRELPALPLEQWRATKDTIHLWAQVVGKVRLAHAPRLDHSWHVTLRVTPRGMTTGRIPVGDTSVMIDFDFVDHELRLTTPDGMARFGLRDGLSVSRFYRDVMGALSDLRMGTDIRPVPYGVPTTTPFAEDTAHQSYDTTSVERFHRVLSFADTALQAFAGWFSGKASPVQVFWHSFDIAHTRFVGDTQIAFGSWAGDDTTPAPTFYSYTSPEPAGLGEQSLHPAAATWFRHRSGVTAHLPYDAVRGAPDSHAAVMEFFSAAYRAGATLSGWDTAALATSWAPSHGDHDG